MNNLLLITGAGASHDVVDDSRVGTNAEYKPPLTRHLFDTKRIGDDLAAPGVHNLFIERCLKNNEIAAYVGYEFQVIAKNGAEESLETYLSNLKNHRLQMKRNQYWATIPYLHELFKEVSGNYIRTGSASSNYKLLIDCVAESKYEKILWLNLNYDLLADYAIKASTHNDLSKLTDYTRLETADGLKIMYTKPHGSVDWFMMIKDPQITRDIIKTGNLPEDFENRINKLVYTGDAAMKERINIGGVISHWFPQRWFPAITAPIGKYEFIYDGHIDAIKLELKNTTTMLCIGFSALDHDILDLIKSYMPRVTKSLFVNGNKKAGKQAYNRIVDYCGWQRGDPEDVDRVTFDGGFTRFVENEMYKWLSAPK